MTEQLPAGSAFAIRTVTLGAALTEAQLASALADPELLSRALAWAGLTVTRLDAQRLRVAADAVSAVVRARVDAARYELCWEEDAQVPVTLALQLRPAAEQSPTAQWSAELEAVPADASAQAQHWLPKILQALPEQLAVELPPASQPAGSSRWVWVVAFLVLLLALGLAV